VATIVFYGDNIITTVERRIALTSRERAALRVASSGLRVP